MSKNNCIFKNERTLASAGSGKTYALTNRYIALVASGVGPEEICALTFTRKAAAEFFDKTMFKLARASIDAKFAESLSGQLNSLAPELGELNCDDFCKILRTFAKSSSKLNLETIDSFCSKYARYFAYELGMFEGVEILDDFSAGIFKSRAIFAALNSLKKTPEAFYAFAQMFKEANFGRDSKSISAKLKDFVKSAEEIFFDIPNPKKWGDKKIFLAKPDFKFDEAQYEKDLEILKTEFEKISDEKELKTKQPILKFFSESNADGIAKANAATLKLAEYFAKNKSSLGFKLEYSKARKNPPTFGLTPAESGAIDSLANALLLSYKKKAHLAAQAIFKILAIYEAIYDSQVRSRGKMTFADIPYMICKNQNDIARELVEYRFDTKFNHWLFDEFQDTSRIQWQVFDELISEAVLNSEGSKSFYYVGDKKQSIYAWRGGDSSLFDEIFEKFKSNISDNPQIKTSWRSCPAVINFVNSVFSDEAAIAAQYGQKIASSWIKDWQNHDVAEINRDKRGQVSYQFCGEDEAPEAVYEYLKNLNPLAKSLSVAVLVQRNSTAQEIIDYLRSRAKSDNFNLRVAGELEIKIASDNQAVPALLSFVESFAHPDDTFASAYAKFTPLKEFIENPESYAKFARDLADFGFQRALEPAAEFLLKNSSDSGDFTEVRIRQFLEAAAAFDASYERNCDLFIKFISDFKIREGAPSDTVQVMSIHKSKGLDFDVVILPELSNPRGNHPKSIFESKQIGAFVMPPKDICIFDAKLSEIQEQIRNEGSGESLCKFYVALTRAKRAIHMILPQTDAKKDYSGKRNFAYLLEDILKCESQSEIFITPDSDAHWADEFGESKQEFIPAKKIQIKKPNQIPPEEIDCPEIPLETKSATALGLAAHSILENLDPENLNVEFASNRAKRLYADFPEEFSAAQKMVSKALENSQIAEILSCKNYWAEYPFHMLENSSLQSGRFDRVNFRGNKAEIIDFKSDKNSAELEMRYAKQLQGYRRALANLTDIAPENISLKIVSLSDSKVIEIKT